MKYIIIINNSPLASQGSLSAYHFAQALTQKGHELVSIFFYQQGAYHGLDNIVLQQDETDIHQCWVELAAQNKLPLHVCSAAALRRATIDTTAAEQYQLPISMHKAYQTISLNQFFALAQTADRMISFD